jgi:hypothetical protein
MTHGGSATHKSIISDKTGEFGLRSRRYVNATNHERSPRPDTSRTSENSTEQIVIVLKKLFGDSR